MMRSVEVRREMVCFVVAVEARSEAVRLVWK